MEAVGDELEALTEWQTVSFGNIFFLVGRWHRCPENINLFSEYLAQQLCCRRSCGHWVALSPTIRFRGLRPHLYRKVLGFGDCGESCTFCVGTGYVATIFRILPGRCHISRSKTSSCLFWGQCVSGGLQHHNILLGCFRTCFKHM